MRRESYSNHFANALEGVDLKHPGTIVSPAICAERSITSELTSSWPRRTAG
jgi:hypothetical protein